MVNRVLAWGAAAGVAVGTGVGEQGRDGATGVAGEGGRDGDLMLVAAVEDLDVERSQQGFADAGGGVGEHGGDVGQQVQQDTSLSGGVSAWRALSWASVRVRWSYSSA